MKEEATPGRKPRHECGGDYAIVAEPVTAVVRGTPVTASQSRYRCQDCGEERLTGAQADAYEAEVYRLYEAMPDRRLLPEEIRSLRERLGLTQPQMEAALGIGEKTVVRWETGRVLQNQATDNLLRLIDRDPSAIEHLAELHGVELPAVSRSAGHEERSEAGVAAGLPESLEARLRSLASADGVDLATYVVMVLSSHTTGAELTGQFGDSLANELAAFSTVLRERWDPDPPQPGRVFQAFSGEAPLGEAWRRSAGTREGFDLVS